MAVCVNCTSAEGGGVGVAGGRLPNTVIRVTTIVPITPIKAAMIVGSILEGFESDMEFPTCSKILLILRQITHLLKTNSLHQHVGDLPIDLAHRVIL